MSERFQGLIRPPEHRAQHSLTMRPYKKPRYASLKRTIDQVSNDPVSNKIMRTAGPYRKFRPRRKSSRRKFKRRRYIPRTLAPYSKMIKVKAVDYVNHNTHTAGAIEMTPLQLNSIDDPFTTNGVGQPLGYDQWKALYKRAYVVGCDIVVRVVNSDSTEAMVVGCTPMPVNMGTTTANNYEHYMEYPGSKQVIVSPDMDHAVLTNTCRLKKHLHLANFRDKENLYLNLDTETPPTDLCYWHLWSQPVTQASDPASGTRMVVTLTYIVVLFDNIYPARSTET